MKIAFVFLLFVSELIGMQPRPKDQPTDIKKYADSEESDATWGNSKEDVSEKIEHFQRNTGQRIANLVETLKTNPDATAYDSDEIPEIIDFLEGKPRGK